MMNQNLFVFVTFLITLVFCQNDGGTSRMKELRTKVDPIRTFDLPQQAPRARIISIDFLKKSNSRIKTTFKDDSQAEDFRRWRLDELTEREMRSSQEVKKNAKHPFSSRSTTTARSSGSSEEDKNLGEFFPTRSRL